MTAKVVQLQVRPGIQRDNTKFRSPCYIDGQWVRFQTGLPRKIGGYRGMFLNAPDITRGMISYSINGLNYVIGGYTDGPRQWYNNNDAGIGSGPVTYTLTGFTPNANNLWQFDIGFDPYGTGNNNLIAHPGQNLNDITSSVNTRPLVGAFTGTTLGPVGVFTASATLTSGHNTITFAETIAAVGPGVSVSGAGIPAGTTVVSVSSVSNVWTAVLSQNATLSGTETLTFDNNISVSGGAVMIYPYLFVYGNYGLIQNCSAGDFNNWTSSDANANNVASSKIVKGLPVRGGSTSPSGLFWSLDSVIRVSYSPTTVNSLTYYWTYDIVTSQSSIMSSQAVIEYDGVFYWCGTDRFLMYNGVVQEVPNTQNLNWFFDNMNYSQRQKVWCTKVPRWGEIWWFYPRGDATECTDAIIYNVREQTWYDAGSAPGARRSAGYFTEVFPHPIWAGNDANNVDTYTLWEHETGTDEVYENQVNAIQSYFETPSLGNLGGLIGSTQILQTAWAQIYPPDANNWTRLERMEPDFVQTGSMNLYVLGKGYADDTDQVTGPYTFTPSTLKVDMREQRREMRLRFESNTTGGNYYMGKVLLSMDVGDVRSTGNPN